MAIATGTALALAAGGSVASGIYSAKKAGDAADQQADALRQSQDITRQATQEARGDIMRLFPQAQQSQLAGLNSALNVFNQAGPAQAGMAQAGNMNAQATLLAGLPQMNNALLGGPIDYSQLQAQQVGFNPNNFMGQLPPELQPEPYGPQQVDTQAMMQNPVINFNNIAKVLGGATSATGSGRAGLTNNPSLRIR